jgi:hypothetical protein
MKINIHLSYIARFFLEWEMFRTKVVKKIKTHTLYVITFLKNCAFYEIRCKNIVELDRPQMTTWRMRISCRIQKTTSPHSEYIILYLFMAFPLQQWLHERALVLSYTYIVCIMNCILRFVSLFWYINTQRQTSLQTTIIYTICSATTKLSADTQAKSRGFTNPTPKVRWCFMFMDPSYEAFFM